MTLQFYSLVIRSLVTIHTDSKERLYSSTNSCISRYFWLKPLIFNSTETPKKFLWNRVSLFVNFFQNLLHRRNENWIVAFLYIYMRYIDTIQSLFMPKQNMNVITVCMCTQSIYPHSRVSFLCVWTIKGCFREKLCCIGKNASLFYLLMFLTLKLSLIVMNTIFKKIGSHRSCWVKNTLT